MKQYLIVLATCLLGIQAYGQLYGSFKDARDGKVYKTVKIGNQLWMAENLNTDRFRNGDLIPEAKTNEEWAYAVEFKEPAWCYYKNSSELGLKYGKLYNYYALTDPRGLAPMGWHVSLIKDWEILFYYLKLDINTGGKLKSKTGWFRNGNGTNQSGFSALPGGTRDLHGNFWDEGSDGYWWSDDFLDGKHIDNRHFMLHHDNNSAGHYNWDIRSGYSVRCISGESMFSKLTPETTKQPQTLISKSESFIDERNNKAYRIVKIGNQEWMAENLVATTFNNGDTIMEAKTNQQWYFAYDNKIPAWCYYNNDSSNDKTCGKLYNWFAVNDPRGLAPKDWHIPDDDEWEQAEIFLGGRDNAGIKLKSKYGWYNVGGGTNISGFNGMPGGCRWTHGEFRDFEKSGFWWSSSALRIDHAWGRGLSHYSTAVEKLYEEKGIGFSVRCIKD